MEARKAYIRQEECVGCGACIPVCPAHAIQMKAGWKSAVNTEKCIGCGTCATLCHRAAPILLMPENDTNKFESNYEFS